MEEPVGKIYLATAQWSLSLSRGQIYGYVQIQIPNTSLPTPFHLSYAALGDEPFVSHSLMLLPVLPCMFFYLHLTRFSHSHARSSCCPLGKKINKLCSPQVGNLKFWVGRSIFFGFFYCIVHEFKLITKCTSFVNQSTMTQSKENIQ